MRPKAHVVLPTYNEAENVRDVLYGIFDQGRAIPPPDLHVLVLDDDSPDGTQHVVRTLMERFRSLRLITGQNRSI